MCVPQVTAVGSGAHERERKRDQARETDVEPEPERRRVARFVVRRPDARDRNHTRYKGDSGHASPVLWTRQGRSSYSKRGSDLQYALHVLIIEKRGTTGVRGKGVSKPWEA